MTPDQAVAFVRETGVVLASAKGPAPNLAQAIAGEPIAGSWWGHPKGRQIFAASQEIEHSPDILVCRAVGGKITFVHRRLWAALVRLAPGLPAERLGRIRQEHTEAGHHENHITPYPDWVPPEVVAEAADLSEADALAALGAWAARP